MTSPRPAARAPRTHRDGVQRVFLHIGAPKTGSTYLQQALWRNRAALAEGGVCYPLDSEHAHFAAALDVSRRPWGGSWNPEWDGAWDRVCGNIRTSTGNLAVFSDELFGLASPAQAAAAVRSLRPAEVHLVFTARDLARQISADWQEQIKHRHTVPFRRFVDDLVRCGIDAPEPFGELFWGLHDPVYVLDKWCDAVPPERIHLITGPRSTAPRELLWRRFATTVGIDPDAYDVEVDLDNRTMGLVEAEFFRRFNLATREQMSRHHGPVLNRVLGQAILSRRPGSQPIRLPAEHAEWARQRSALMRDELIARGFDIVGDTDELIPQQDDAVPQEDPEKFPPSAINAVAYDAVAGLVDQVVSLRGRARNLAAWIEDRERGAVDRLDKMHRGDEPR